MSSAKNKSGLLLSHLGAVLVMSAWGASFVSTKVLLDNGLHPAEIYVYRFLLAYLLILIVCHKRLWSRTWRDELLFATCGLCGGSIYFIAENTALQYTFATNVSLITSLSPIITTIIIGAIYKSERPKRGFIYGSSIAFVGVACVVLNSSTSLEVRPLGDFLSLLAAIAWSVYSIVLKRLNRTYSVMFISRKTFFYGIITAIPFVLIEPEIASPAILLRPTVMANLLFLGLFASMLGYVLWAEAIKRLGALTASNYLYFQPIVTMIASALLIDERVTVVGVVGCALIIIGVWLSDFLSRRQIKRL